MFHLIKHWISSQNQFATGGLLLMVMGGVGALVRALPGHLWSWLVRQNTLMLTVKDDDASFQWVKEWLLEQQFLRRLRRVDLDTTLRGTEMALIPAPGRHMFWYEGRPLWVWFYRGEDPKGRAQRRSESMTFQTLGRNQRRLRRLVDEILACHRRKTDRSSCLYVYDDYWTAVQAYSPRLLESVILKPGEKERVMQDLERFRGSRARYRQLGVPYHRGYLLHGPPGTGKTSLVSALAASFGLSIYALNLTELTDRTLKAAMNEVPENSMVLFEDIDCMGAGNRRRMGVDSEMAAGEKNDRRTAAGVTLSGLLNVLDGFHAPDNVVFAMTTNHADTLDPALLRPGRIDYKLYLGAAGPAQKEELYRRFFPAASELEARRFARAHEAETMAECQGRLLRLEEEGRCGVREEACDFDAGKKVEVAGSWRTT